MENLSIEVKHLPKKSKYLSFKDAEDCKTMDSLDELIQAEKELDQPVSLMDLEEVRKAKKKSENIFETSFLETKEYILEQIGNAELAGERKHKKGSEMCDFIKFSKLTGEIEKVDHFVVGEKVYRPIVDDIFLKGGVSLPTGIEEYGNTKQLIDEIREYISSKVELPTSPINYEKFIPNLILFYWLYDKFPFIPYVHFVGGTATGKTTAMEVVGSLCYKPIDSSSSLTTASMFRIATQWRGTLLIDEFEKAGTNAKEIILFLKAGVSNRLLYRVEGEGKKQLTAYVIKSPKIFTSENPIDDAGLQSRTIVIKMEKAKRKLPLFRLEEDYKEAETLRNKLLLWRFRNYQKIDLSKIKYGFPELEVFDRRVQQILTPIYYFTDKEARQNIIEFAKEQESETLRERRESLDGVIFDILLEIWSNGEEAQIKAITSMLNEERRGDGFKTDITAKKVGNVIRKILGFETERRGNDRSYWVIRDDYKIKSKAEYYGIPLSNLSFVATASSASEAKEDKNAELTAREIFKI